MRRLIVTTSNECLNVYPKPSKERWAGVVSDARLLRWSIIYRRYALDEIIIVFDIHEGRWIIDEDNRITIERQNR